MVIKIEIMLSQSEVDYVFNLNNSDRIVILDADIISSTPLSLFDQFL